MMRRRYAEGEMTLECVVSNLTEARAVAQLGVCRIEVGAAPELGGLTPSSGTLAEICADRDPSTCTIAVLIRPRAGGFYYDTNEVAAMVNDIQHFATFGVEDVVFGALTPEGSLDIEAVTRLTDVAKSSGLGTVFHRAIDVCTNPEQALEQLGGLSIDRVLTSGAARTCVRGLQTLVHWVSAYPNLEFVPAGGIRESNVLAITHALAVPFLHAGPRTLISGPATRLYDVDYGTHTVADMAAIRALMRTLQST